MLVARFLLTLAVVLLFVSFAAYNMEMVELTFSPGDPAVVLPLYSVIFLALFAGGLIAYVLGLLDRFALSRRVKERDEEIARLREELRGLRNLSIVDDPGSAADTAEGGRNGAEA